MEPNNTGGQETTGGESENKWHSVCRECPHEGLFDTLGEVQSDVQDHEEECDDSRFVIEEVNCQ